MKDLNPRGNLLSPFNSHSPLCNRGWLGHLAEALAALQQRKQLNTIDVRSLLMVGLVTVITSSGETSSIKVVYCHKPERQFSLITEMVHVPVVRLQSDPQDSLERRLRFETLLADISAEFANVPGTRVDDEIQASLGIIRKYLGMDYAAVWQFSGDDRGCFKLSHLSCEPNLPSVSIGTNGADYWPWTATRIMANEIVWVPDTDQCPPEAEQDILSWKQWNIKSTLIIPLSAGGLIPAGALGFSGRSVGYWPNSLQRLRLIAQVYANALERKRTEQKLLENEARLRLAADSAGVGFWTLDPVNNQLWTTPKLRQILGLDCKDELDYDTFLRMIHPDDVARVQNSISDAMLSGMQLTVEYRIVQDDGTLRIIAASGCRHSSTFNGRVILTGVAIDITERKRAEEARRSINRRVMQAQESERSRIARELHDDIGQALALLRIRINGAGQPVSNDPWKANPNLTELAEEVGKIAQRISKISHQFHSSELDYLGLQVAVEALCRETAAKYGVSLACTCHEVPKDLDKSLALNVFRVVQEATHNIGNHSGAKHIEVRLQGSGDELTLSIVDDGRGFDLKGATYSPGLGLISMRERIEMLGGKFELFSNPGEGTRILARVPIKTARAKPS